MTTLASEAVVEALADAPVAAVVERSGFVESVHRALITVTNSDGSVMASWGDPEAVIFPRSSNKPLQTVAMVRAGLDLDDELLALVSSSHSGEPFHLDGVRRILATAGLSEDALQNTPSLPLDGEERDAWVRDGRGASSLAQNCSGKHAGMLAACRASGWDVETYRDPNHPLQVLMAETLAELADDAVCAIGIDGCGAPVMSLSMAGLARAFGRLAAAPSARPESAEARVAQAMVNAPKYVGGTRRDVTQLIAGTPGLIAKDGAEAVYAIGLPDGRGVAIKMADGGGRARAVVAAAVLRQLGVKSEAYAELERADVLGHGQPVGQIRATLGAPSSGHLGAGVVGRGES